MTTVSRFENWSALCGSVNQVLADHRPAVVPSNSSNAVLDSKSESSNFLLLEYWHRILI